MKLAQAELQAWAESQGLPTGTSAGTGGGQGQAQSKPPETRATLEAQRGAATTSAMSQALLDAVMKQLETGRLPRWKHQRRRL